MTIAPITGRVVKTQKAPDASERASLCFAVVIGVGVRSVCDGVSRVVQQQYDGVELPAGPVVRP